MKSSFHFEIAERIQKFISEHINEPDFSAKDVFNKFNYSQRHLNRIYRHFTGKTVSSYISATKLSNSTYDIQNGKGILSTALNAGYQTNEGYSKAFSKAFGKTPSEYKQNNEMIKRFIPYPVRHSYEHYHPKEDNKMKNTIVCTAYTVSKPRRKMIILRSEKAEEYWSFCEEMCCDWEGYLNSNPAKLDTAAILKLPKEFHKTGFSDIAAGIEVPVDYENNELDSNYEIIELNPCKFIYFKSQPFSVSDDYCKYMNAVNKAYNNFDFASLEIEVDYTEGPYMNFGAEPERGAKIAYPVKDISK